MWRSNFETAPDPDQVDRLSIMNETNPDSHDDDFSSSEQQPWQSQGSEALIVASLGIQHPYYTMDMQSPPADNDVPESTSNHACTGENEFDSSYAFEEMELLDASTSLDLWAVGDTNHNASLPPLPCNEQAQAPYGSSSRSLNTRVYFNSEDWTFIQNEPQEGPLVIESLSYPYCDSSGEAGMKYSTSEASHDPSSSNIGNTRTTNTSCEVVTNQSRFQNEMCDSLATLKAPPNVYKTASTSRPGSTSSAKSVYNGSNSRMDVDFEQSRNGYSRCAPKHRASSRSVEILSMV
jgi:hypothetical protein